MATTPMAQSQGQGPEAKIAELQRANAALLAERDVARVREAALTEVLGVINRTPTELQPVLDKLVETAARLCDSEMVMINRRDDKMMWVAANHGYPKELWAYWMAVGRIPLDPEVPTVEMRTLVEGRVVHIHDASAVPNYPTPHIDLGGLRTILGAPMRHGDKVIGMIGLARQRVEPFTEQQIALLEAFAAQAVIAIENARLIAEQREALEQQTATAEVLGVINASPGNLAPVFDAILDKAMRLCGVAFGTLNTWDGKAIRYVAARGIPKALAEWQQRNPVREPGAGVWRAIETQRSQQLLDTREGEGYKAGQPAPRANVDLGGVRTSLFVPLVQEKLVFGFFHFFRQEVRAFTDKEIALLENFAAQAVIAMENARLINEIRAARDAAEAALVDLRRAQDRLVQSEKMASLGQLTAGVAHEIKNPLNFVNNFSDLSADLLDELHEALGPVEDGMDPKLRAEIEELTTTLKGNLAKIAEHGRRADSIVKNMLEHSRSGTSERRAVDLNAMAEEALNLAYHGARAEIPGFNITMEKDLDPAVGKVELYPQELTRVLVNLINNGFYAVRKRAERGEAGFEPTLRLSTRAADGQVEVVVRDNGTGIPAEVREKIFEPFFTTKPAGEGTGLGLSLSYDIVVKQHGGQLGVESEPSVFTEFTITLPRYPAGTSDGEDKRA